MFGGDRLYIIMFKDGSETTHDGLERREDV